MQKKSIDKLDQIVSTDQIVSAQPRLVPQEKGQLTRARIWGATICVNYVKKWVKVVLIKQATGDETLEAKHAFEHQCATCGVNR